MIASWFGFADQGEAFPETLPITLKRGATLRYGENPHQSAAFYTATGPAARGVGQARQVQGKELSYNTITTTPMPRSSWSASSAMRSRPSSSSSTPIPAASPPPRRSSRPMPRRFACDTVSAFGGIIALNRALDEATARAISGIFTEVVIAPDADEAALAIFAAKKNLRLLPPATCPMRRGTASWPSRSPAAWLVRTRDNGAGLLAGRLGTSPRLISRW